MCGRYTLTARPDAIATAFGATEVGADLRPRYNIAPGQNVAVIANRTPRRVEFFRWGLVPSWAKDPAIGHRMINARAETAADKPSFRSALRRRRCLVLADGFYEWKREGKHKVPYYLYRAEHAPFAFAGLWEAWHPDDTPPLHSCTILTTEANPLVAPIHDRMPVILPPAEYDLWLTEAALDPEVVRPLLEPYPAEALRAHPVSTLVNRPTNDDPACIAPSAPCGDTG